MLGPHPVVAFVATVRPADALAFYRDVLGLRLVEETPFAIVFDAGGTTLRVQKAPDHVPPQHTVLGWSVPDLDATMQALAGKGVGFVRYDFLDQDAAGVWTAPDGTRIAWFRDPDGNLLSLTQA